MLLRLFASVKEILFKNYFLNLASLLLGFPYFRKALFAARGRIIINVFGVVNTQQKDFASKPHLLYRSPPLTTKYGKKDYSANS